MQGTAQRENAGPPHCTLPAGAGLFAVLLLLSVSAAGAADTPAAGGITPVIEMSTSSLPRFDAADGSQRTQRVDMALLSPGRSAFGLTMGIAAPSASRYGFTGAGPDASGSVNLGLQWRYTLENNRRVDITAWHDVGRPSDALAMIQSREAAYGARVEMQLSGPRSRLVADHGFIGMQLDGGGRITVRRSAGKPMVYYRNNF